MILRSENVISKAKSGDAVLAERRHTLLFKPTDWEKMSTDQDPGMQ